MNRSSIRRQCLGLFIVLISAFVIIYQTSSYSDLVPNITEEKELDYNFEVSEEIYSKPIETSSNSKAFGPDAIFGEPIKATDNALNNDQFVVAQRNDGRYYCIWIQEKTKRSYTLFYTISSNSSGIDWNESLPLFRTDLSMFYLTAIVDDNNTLHIFFKQYRNDYIRITHVMKPENSTDIEINEVYKTKLYLFYDIHIAKTNNTIYVGWVDKTKDSDNNWWDSHIKIARLDTITYNWDLDYWILHNDTNPIEFNIASINNTISLCYSISNNFTTIQDLLLTSYNESTEMWSPYVNITRSDKKIGMIKIQPSLDGGSHILWKKLEQYYSIRYIKCDEDNQVINYTQRINNYNYNNDHAFLVEEDNGDLILLIEDLYGFDSHIYYRRKFASNESWSDLEKIHADGSKADLFLFKNDKDSQRKCNIFFRYLGSIFARSLNATYGWSDDTYVYYGLDDVRHPTAVIDNNGVIHLMTYHTVKGIDQLIYQQKYPNETRWRTFRNFMYLGDETTPKLIVDPNGTLYCYGVVYDSGSGYYAIHSMYKDQIGDNWSIPEVAFAPSYHISPYDQIEILFDSKNRTHLIWRQEYQTFVYMYHTYREQGNLTFATPVRLENKQVNSISYHYDAIIDFEDTIHLANCEYSFDFDITSLVYRSKEENGTWSEGETITASYEYIFSPRLVQDSTGKLELIVNDCTAISLFHVFYWTDFLLYEKMPEDSSWTYNGKILEDTGSAGFFDVLMSSDDELYLMYYYGDYSGPWWHNLEVEKLTIMKRVDGIWSDGIVLNEEKHEKRSPITLLNEDTGQISVIHEYEGTIDWYTMQNDTDGDLLGDYDEYFFCTNITNPDSDQDGLSDGFEVQESLSNPMHDDTDWDTIPDGDEVLIYQSNPLSLDSDYDKIEDSLEILVYGSDPTNQDTDGDSIPDYDEIFLLGSDPTSSDTDSDGMPDKWEYDNSLNLLVDDSSNDEDNDSLLNLGEYLNGTDVYNPDTDSDLLLDGEEVLVYLTDPNNPDTDFDSITDWEEVMKFHTNPFLVDSDGDGFTDRQEIEAGTDPMDPKDNVRLRQIRTILLYSIIPVTIITILIVVFEVRFRRKAKTQKLEEEEELTKELSILEDIKENDIEE
ncbi:MAG: hypothetical protein FK733_17980 [Asgard group archaeon]|nr:hypothetical protein [Asgard group archaeon]